LLGVSGVEIFGCFTAGSFPNMSLSLFSLVLGDPLGLVLDGEPLAVEGVDLGGLLFSLVLSAFLFVVLWCLVTEMSCLAVLPLRTDLGDSGLPDLDLGFTLGDLAQLRLFAGVTREGGEFFGLSFGEPGAVALFVLLGDPILLGEDCLIGSLELDGAGILLFDFRPTLAPLFGL